MFKDKVCLSGKQTGAIAVLVALSLPILLGTVSMGVEVGAWYARARELQTAADAAAIAAAFELSESNEDDMDTSAEEEAERNSFDSTEGTLVMNHPPENGDYIDEDDAVEIILSEPYPLAATAIFLDQDPIITARAVAYAEPAQGTETACVLALDETACGAITISGSANIGLSGCVIASNSSCDSGLLLAGSGTLTAQSASLVGGYEQGSSATFNYDTAPKTGLTPTEDPYAALEVEPYAGCDHTNKALNGQTSTTLSPGVYCQGLTINEKGPTTLLPGVYIMDGGNFRINSGSDVDGEGVTIILTASNGQDYADVQINGGADVDIEAPTSGPYSGVVFFGDPDSNGSMDLKFNGGANMNINGAIYFPQDDVEFKGNSSSTPSCTQIVAKTVGFTGNTSANHDCEDSGTSDILPYVEGSVALVE